MLGSASPSASVRPPFVAMGQVWGGQDKTNVPHGKKNLCVSCIVFEYELPCAVKGSSLNMMQ